MREISLFWRRNRLEETDISPLLDIVSSIEFLAYIKRTPRDIQILVKINFKSGKHPEDLNSLYFLELMDIHHTPESSDESYVINLKLSHPLSNFNARTGGTTAAPGCKLDSEGMTYIIQGGNMRLRLVAAMARLMAKPDRISARSLDLSSSFETGPLNAKQLKLAKFAYDKGWYDINKRIRISEMAEELKIARATLAEHLSRIESIIMDDLLGSFTNFRISPDEFELFKDMAVEDSKNLGFGEDEQFKKLLQNMHENMEHEGVPEDDDYENE
ncbi:MAG: hypothetical protein CMA90_03130 [Euryarchaeota archaeon]|nr:hypothetical protein [Euryarchaeota archaeon]|tara:strand:+ start:204 stop:1019 length:816 start_codon:yes stop_codon:yes gene_type:complete